MTFMSILMILGKVTLVLTSGLVAVGLSARVPRRFVISF